PFTTKLPEKMQRPSRPNISLFSFTACQTTPTISIGSAARRPALVFPPGATAPKRGSSSMLRTPWHDKLHSGGNDDPGTRAHDRAPRRPVRGQAVRLPWLRFAFGPTRHVWGQADPRAADDPGGRRHLRDR